MSVLSQPVVLLPSLPVGNNVNHDPAEVRQVVEELMANLLRDLVTISDRQPPGHRDAHLRVQAMPDPAGPEIGDLLRGHVADEEGRMSEVEILWREAASS